MGSFALLFIALFILAHSDIDHSSLDGNILNSIEFDEESIETYGGSTQYEIGWKRVMFCNEAYYGAASGKSLFRYTGDGGESDSSEFEALAPYAITIKIVPDYSDNLSQEEFDNYAVYGLMCRDEMVAVNNLRQLSFSRSWWAKTAIAKSRMRVDCPAGLNPQTPLTEKIFHAGCWGYGMCIWVPDACAFAGTNPRYGKSIAVFFGFDKNKRNVCDGAGNGGFITLPSPATKNPTIDVCSQCTCDCTECTPTPAPTFEPCTNENVKFNINFIIDESGSVKANNYQNAIGFVKNLILNDINRGSAISALAFNANNDHIYSFNNDQSNRNGIINELNKEQFDYGGGITDTYNAILKGVDMFGMGGTVDSPDLNIMFLITDGRPTCVDNDSDDCHKYLCQSANEASVDGQRLIDALQSEDIRLYILGIGKFDEYVSEIECLVTQKQYIYAMPDFTHGEFKQIEREFRQILCPSQVGGGGGDAKYVGFSIDGNNAYDYYGNTHVSLYKYLLLNVLVTVSTVVLCVACFWFCCFRKVKGRVYEKVSVNNNI